jgi:hypothetical protein
MTLLQDLRRDLPSSMPFPIGQNPEGSKADRASSCYPKSEAARLILVDELNAGSSEID